MSVWRNRSGARSSRAPSSFIEPCLPTVREAVPVAPGWVYEVKHDGYRLQIHKRADRVRLYTRTGADWTDRYPAIVASAVRLKASRFIIDAECVFCDQHGLSHFDVLHSRVRDEECCAYVFDLMELDGQDLRRRPWEERRKHLAKLIGKGRGALLFSEHLTGDGNEIFRHVCALGLEGIVAKRIASPYRSGRSPDWIKVKNKNAPAFRRVMEDV